MSKNILIGCTGSVATIKLPIICEKLLNNNKKYQINIKIIVTEKAKHFYNKNEIPDCVEIYDDQIEWDSWKTRGDPVIHIDLTKWADIFVIAPLDANSLSKISNGLCDNLLLSTARAWDLSKPFLFCPAMNTKMWEHPITNGQIEILKSWGYKEIACISKTLMCGDTGNGAMAEVDTIIERIFLELK